MDADMNDVEVMEDPAILGAGSHRDAEIPVSEIEIFEPDIEVTDSVQLVPVGPKFVIDPEHCSLALNQKAGKPTREEFGVALGRVGEATGQLPWIIGDLLNLMESMYGEDHSQYLDPDGPLSESTCKVYRWVCSRVKPPVRPIAQSFSHAQIVASLNEAQQVSWLTKSRNEDWAVAKLKTEVAASDKEGKHVLKFVLVVDCGTEHKMQKLSKELEEQGFKTTQRSSVGAKEAKPKKEKKAKVTAQGKRPKKMNQTKRPPAVPQGWKGD